MELKYVDWSIIIGYFVITLVIGLLVSKRSSQSVKEYFQAGQKMPWWLLGISMVATTFSADTPNLVTDIIRKNGVSGNWVWWAFLITGMTTVFIYAKLWRRSGITTDLEFYEMRYSGIESVFLRGFRALYLGVFFNVMIMATVLLAGIKIAGIMLGISPLQTVIIVSVFTLIYTSLGGLRGVILTDFFQFTLGMLGMILACIYIVNLPEIGGIQDLITHPNVRPKINLLPDFSNPEVYVPLFLVPIAVQWWSSWYPGSEPGGGGYVAQRMLSAKNEGDAVKATFFFNAAHYALRPWPWILIALASLVIYPNLEDLKSSFPSISESILNDDLAFPAMLNLLPAGLLGIVIAALIAALMSTISTHLNWGSSYIVNDFYARFLNPEANQKELITVGRVGGVLLMVLSAIMALFLSNALQAFNILLQIGAGTGLLFLLRWFWWRINAYSEISAMLISLVLAIYFEIFYSGDLASWQVLLISVAITTATWMLVTLMTRPTDQERLITFYEKINPHAFGWRPIAQYSKTRINHGRSFAMELLMIFLGCIGIYAALFFVGYVIYSRVALACIALTLVVLSVLGLRIIWKTS